MAFDAVDGKYNQAGEIELRIHQTQPLGYLTVSAVREWFTHTKKVTLFVDTERSLLGFKRGSSDDGDTYTLSSKDSGGGNIAIKTALRRLDITVDDITDTWKFPFEFNDAESLIVADLKRLVEHHTGAVHCEECGQRCKNETGLNSHYSKQHDSNGRQALEEMDPDEIGDPFPEEPTEGDA